MTRLIKWFICLSICAAGIPVHAGQFMEREYGSLHYKVFIPDAYQEGDKVPMVVMLHGCLQDPDRIATNTRLNDYAEQQGFIAVYPKQDNIVLGVLPWQSTTLRCWQWFDPANQSRDAGVAAAIVKVIDKVAENYSIDSKRVYIAGLSAGAAMSVMLGVLYPDKFAAIGVSAGLEYKAATGRTSAMTAMRYGGPDPDTQGRLAYEAMGSLARPMPIIVFHGTDDRTVAPQNGTQVIAQWAQTGDLAIDGGMDDDDIDAIADSVVQDTVRLVDGSMGHSYTRSIYHDHHGKAWLIEYIVDGMRHAWSGGSPKAHWLVGFMWDPFTDANGPDATQIMLQFFAEHPLPDE